MNRDFKKTKTREQVAVAFNDFARGNKDILVSVCIYGMCLMYTMCSNCIYMGDQKHNVMSSLTKTTKKKLFQTYIFYKKYNNGIVFCVALFLMIFD